MNLKGVTCWLESSADAIDKFDEVVPTPRNLYRDIITQRNKREAKLIVRAIKKALEFYGVEQDRTTRRLAIRLARDVQSIYRG